MRLKAAERELTAFRSGDAYAKLRAGYESVIREQNIAIKKFQKERDGFSFSRKETTRQWMDVLDDVQKEYEKETKKLALRQGRVPRAWGWNGLCREFSAKTKEEQDFLFTALLDAPVMHVDGTCARASGENKNVLVCSNGSAGTAMTGRRQIHCRYNQCTVNNNSRLP